MAAIGMGIYFAEVGLDKATDVATVVGLFVALAGLVVAVYGIRAGRADPAPGSAAEPATGDAVTNVITGSTINGTVIQGRHITPPGQ
ncbi:MAG TPA: hypothetical protein VHZ03_16330 [Trebonia sp.]|nr:hypothetical protein [Trebonia sp.]